MAETYPGFNENDTAWDEHHKEQGLMTNREFFTSNAKGGFYEGMDWDEVSQQWVLNAEERQKQIAYEQANRCSECGYLYSACFC